MDFHVARNCVCCSAVMDDSVYSEMSIGIDVVNVGVSSSSCFFIFNIWNKVRKSFNLKVFPISAEFWARMKSNRTSGPWKIIFGCVLEKEFVRSSWKELQKTIWSRNHHNRSTSVASGAPWHQNSNAPSNFRAARVRIRWKNEFLRWWKPN